MVNTTWYYELCQEDAAHRLMPAAKLFLKKGVDTIPKTCYHELCQGGTNLLNHKTKEGIEMIEIYGIELEESGDKKLMDLFAHAFRKYQHSVQNIVWSKEHYVALQAEEIFFRGQVTALGAALNMDSALLERVMNKTVSVAYRDYRALMGKRS